MASSPYINHFLQPDTLIPDPSNPQAWNRYSYVGNNPVNFNDPSGHDSVISDFLAGVVSEVASSIGWFVPPLQADLAPQENESVAMLAGRVVGDIVSMVGGVAATGVGGGGMAGGGGLCLTGVGCLAGAPAIAVSGVIAAEGAAAATRGAMGLGANLYLMAKKIGGDPTGKRPSWRTGYSKEDFIDQYGEFCPLCGKKISSSNLSRDHVTPWKTLKKLLGSRAEEIDVYHDWENLVGLCNSCNSKKQAKSLVVFMWNKLNGK